MKVTLHVKGQGHVPSFKNKKRICGRRLVTEPRIKEWMDRCTASLSAQLLSEYQTGGVGMLMVQPPPSWIASLLPLDDSIQWIPELTVRVELVPAGEEGAEIVIEPIV